VSFVDEPASFFVDPESGADFELSAELDPFTEDVDADRESVMYHPLPLKTIPTG
jgi:hypothetical protein